MRKLCPLFRILNMKFLAQQDYISKRWTLAWIVLSSSLSFLLLPCVCSGTMAQQGKELNLGALLGRQLFPWGPYIRGYKRWPTASKLRILTLHAFSENLFGTVPMFLWLYFAIDYWSIYRICHRTICAQKKKEFYTVNKWQPRRGLPFPAVRQRYF